VRSADQATEGLVILSNTGDSVYGGAPGDNTTILRALIDAQVDGPALVPVVDLEAQEAAHRAGVGAEISVSVGGKMDSEFSSPIELKALVQALSHGFVVDLKDRGVCFLRRTALLEVRGVRVALLGHRSFAVNHPVLYHPSWDRRVPREDSCGEDGKQFPVLCRVAERFDPCGFARHDTIESDSFQLAPRTETQLPLGRSVGLARLVPAILERRVVCQGIALVPPVLRVPPPIAI
jgi:hypothetical protein